MGIRTTLERRADVRRNIRALFDAAGFLEVDTPVLAAEVLPEAHIDPVAVRLAGTADPRWLQAAGSGPIYQFAPAFRDGERGPQHDVEFTILEWYAPGTSLDDAANLLERLCAAVLGTRGLDRTTCAAAFSQHAGVDPVSASPGELLAAVARHVRVRPEGLADLGPADLADRCFELLLSEVVQPRLGQGRPLMLEAWPASQAAFARIDAGPPAAARQALPPSPALPPVPPQPQQYLHQQQRQKHSSSDSNEGFFGAS